MSNLSSAHQVENYYKLRARDDFRKFGDFPGLSITDGLKIGSPERLAYHAEAGQIRTEQGNGH